MPDLAKFFDIEGNLLAALAQSLEDRNIIALEAQRGELRQGSRAELMLNLAGANEEEEIHPHTLEPFYVEYLGTLIVSVRGPVGEYENHRRLVGRIRSLLEQRSGRAMLCEHQTFYTPLGIMPRESINAIEYSEDSQNEIVTELSFSIRFRLNTAQIPLA